MNAYGFPIRVGPGKNGAPGHHALPIRRLRAWVVGWPGHGFLLRLQLRSIHGDVGHRLEYHHAALSALPVTHQTNLGSILPALWRKTVAMRQDQDPRPRELRNSQQLAERVAPIGQAHFESVPRRCPALRRILNIRLREGLLQSGRVDYTAPFVFHLGRRPVVPALPIVGSRSP